MSSYFAEKCRSQTVIMPVLTEYRSVTDGRTDRTEVTESKMKSGFKKIEIWKILQAYSTTQQTHSLKTSEVARSPICTISAHYKPKSIDDGDKFVNR